MSIIQTLVSELILIRIEPSIAFHEYELKYCYLKIQISHPKLNILLHIFRIQTLPEFQILLPDRNRNQKSSRFSFGFEYQTIRTPLKFFLCIVSFAIVFLTDTLFNTNKFFTGYGQLSKIIRVKFSPVTDLTK